MLAKSTDADRNKISRMHIETIKCRMQNYAQSLTGGYRGSRLQKARYMYANTIRANFIELGVEHQLSEDDFHALLCEVEGVRAVALHPKSKLEQNLIESHGIDGWMTMYGCTHTVSCFTT